MADFEIPKTLQEIFDVVGGHLLAQNKISANSSGICMYRFGELKCAAGALVPDSCYTPDMESRTWDDLVDHGMVPKEFKYEIKGLQAIHDCYDPKHWKEQLLIFANRHKLSTVKIDDMAKTQQQICVQDHQN